MSWLVTANSNTCRIYHLKRQGFVLTLLKEIEHPEMKLKPSEHLTTDKPGKYHANGTQQGAFEPHTNPKEVEIEHFTHEVAKALNKARNENAFEGLILVAEPGMMGRLNKHLDKHVVSMIEREIHKDVVRLSQHELSEFIKNAFRPV
jgi:protein required for attachment to host cells